MKQGCVFRYQYLELAHYLIHGECPDAPKSIGQEEGYILSASVRAFTDGFGHFVRATSAVLNVEKPDLSTLEVAFGGRVEERYSPLATGEIRSFIYSDKKVRFSPYMVVL